MSDFYGVGYNSVSKGFKASHKIGDKWIVCKSYRIWHSMLRRCYSEGNDKNYRDVTVCSEWHDFQNFAEWYEHQPDYRKGKGWHLDKDIIDYSARKYSPDTCRLVPIRINLMVRTMAERDCEQGVNWHKRDEAYRAFVNDENGKRIEKNGFKTKEAAFEWYKVQKPLVMYRAALKYRDVIDEDVFEALCNYKVEGRI